MDNPLHAGRRPILRWTVRMRLDTSGESNPAVNRKAVCKVHSTLVLAWASVLVLTAARCCTTVCCKS